jgi:hypothetical protein
MDEITILTLATDDGFSISFGLKADDLKCLESSARSARHRERPAAIRN